MVCSEPVAQRILCGGNDGSWERLVFIYFFFVRAGRVVGREVEEDVSLCHVFLFIITASFIVISASFIVIWQQRHYLMVAMDMGYIRIIF